MVLFVIGGWLEGPPTRLLVRSPSFIFTSYALSFCASYFFTQRNVLTRAVLIVQALVVPSGWLYAVQHYYHGGKNQDYTLISLFFGLLMMINGILYLLSLFIGRKADSRNLNQHHLSTMSSHFTD